MSNGTQIAVLDSQVIAHINGWGQERFFPFFQGHNFDAWKQDAALAIIESADLKSAMATDTGKISLVRALQRSASSGLSLNPQKGESALVPIGGKINFWPMKNGIIKKALETGALEFIEANTIYTGDKFCIKKTARGDDYDFSPALEGRGDDHAYFAVAVLKSGRSVVEYWTKAQVENHRKKFSKGSTAWNTNFDSMAEKTVLKALLSGLHLPQSVSSLIEMDTEAEQAEIRDVTEAPAEKGTSAEGLAAELAAQPDENPAPAAGNPATDDSLF